MFLKNKSFVSIVLCLLLTNNLFSNEDNLFVSKDGVKINNNKKIDDSILREGQSELDNTLSNSDELTTIEKNKESSFKLIPLEPTATNESESFSLRTLMNDYMDWDFAIDPTISLDKEYRWATFNSTEWVNVLRDIGTYEDFIVEISETNKTIKLIKKVKTKFDISKFEEKDINYFLKKLKEDFERTEIYRYKDILYLEGNKFEIEKAISELEKFNNSIKKSISKFVINVYEVDENNQSGLVAMIDKYNIEPTKKIILKNPKIKKPYKINLGNQELIIKINSNGVELNDVLINQNDLKFYGYKTKKWFVEVKSIEI